jgi:hypothetical protein
VRGFEHQMQTVFKPTPTIQLLLTLPGVGLMRAPDVQARSEADAHASPAGDRSAGRGESLDGDGVAERIEVQGA